MRSKNSFITSARRNDKLDKVDDLVTIVILGENHGYRMKSYGPLPLIKIHNKTLIERQIESIKATFTNFEIILCVGFEATKTINFIKNKFPKINIRTVENQVYLNSNCCESARLCINNTSNDRIILCGGGVYLLPQQLELLDLSKTSIVSQNQIDDSNFDIGVIQNNNNLEQLSIGVKSNYWTEMVYLTNIETINTFSSIISNPEYKNRFIFEAINSLSHKIKINVQYNNTGNPVVKIDNIKILKRIIHT
jgi:choline kinase